MKTLTLYKVFKFKGILLFTNVIPLRGIPQEFHLEFNICKKQKQPIKNQNTVGVQQLK